MTKENLTGYKEALELTLDAILPLENKTVPIAECLGRILCEDLYSRVDSPFSDASLKDGYALRSDDISNATHESPVKLDIIGTAAAGTPALENVKKGKAIRILTGAEVPKGADAVLAEEFTKRSGQQLIVEDVSQSGRNILLKGTDVASGDLIAEKGTRITPGIAGLLAAAGHFEIPVYLRPRVCILSTGDELVSPGEPLEQGKLYASNLEMLKAWCIKFGFSTTVHIVKDQPDIITETISREIKTHDAVITSGGAWTGDKDFVGVTLKELGWKKLFHRIRIGPGKAVGCGMLQNKPVFLLPGGPPSTLAGFLQIAVPGLLKLSGSGITALSPVLAELEDEIECRNKDWTEFKYGYLKQVGTQMKFKQLKLKSRLKSIAEARCMITVPEGVKSYPAGTIVPVQILTL